MKNLYQTPALQVIICDDEDLLTLSNVGDKNIDEIEGKSWNELFI